MLQIFGLGPVWSGTVASSSQSALLLRLGLSESLKMLRINLHDLCSTTRPLFTKSNLVVAGASLQTSGVLVGALEATLVGALVGASVGTADMVGLGLTVGGGEHTSDASWHQGPTFGFGFSLSGHPAKQRFCTNPAHGT